MRLANLLFLVLLGLANRASAELVGHWTFDNVVGTTVPDLAGGDDTGTLVNLATISPSTAPVPSGTTHAADLGASWVGGLNDKDAVTAVETGNLSPGTGDWSLALWFNTRTIDAVVPGGLNKQIMYGDSGSGKNVVVFELRTNTAAEGTRLESFFRDGASNSVSSYKTGLGIEANVWYHYAVTRSGGEINVYLDGALVDTASGMLGNVNTTGGPLPSIAGSNQSRSFNGLIDDVRVYNHALDESEIQDLPSGPEKAVSPDPRDGATGVEPDLVLSWRPGDEAIWHDVYLGINPNDVNNANLTSDEYEDTVDANRCEPSDLELGQIYFWRVDEIDDSNTHKGDIWSFTVASPLAHDPYVPDGGAGPPAVVLTWSPGYGTESHDIYFGTDSNEVNSAQRLRGDLDGEGRVNWSDVLLLVEHWVGIDGEADLDGFGRVNLVDFAIMASSWMETSSEVFMGNQPFDCTTFDPGLLEFGRTYYWRVDEVASAHTYKGDVWSFETAITGDMVSMENRDERHFVIRRDDSMFEEFPELCLLPSGKLLCVYKVGPTHGPGGLVILLESDDRGRTWKTLHEFSIECNMPRLQQLSDGRLWLDVDRNGKVLFSEDLGETWTEHNIGFAAHGHDRITELPDGSWINSTCEGTGGWNFRGSPLRIVQYRSTDKGRTWNRDAIVADVPGFNLTEATTVLLADGKLVSYIRESSGLAHGCVRAVSTDNGHTWQVDRAPFNFAMPRAGLLRDGRMLVVGRNFAGNKSLYAWCDQPLASAGFKVQSMWAPDDSAVLTGEGLRIRCTDAEPTGAAAERLWTARAFDPSLTTSGIEPPVYILPAPRRRETKVTIDARLRVLSNETGSACVISITEAQEVLFFPDRVEIFGQPDKAFKLDATKFHDYRVVRDADSLAVFVDGTGRIRTSDLARSRKVGYGIDTTHFGTSYRGFSHDFGSQDHFCRRAVVGKGESVWQRVEITVENPGAPNDTWSWDATTLEFPNQHEMDRIVEVKFQPLPHGQGGPSWVQFPDGEILVVHNGAMAEDAPKPFLMGCYLYPSDFKAQTRRSR